MKTYNACKKEVAEKHRLGTTLVTGHTSKYYEEAAFLHAREQAIAFVEWLVSLPVERIGVGLWEVGSGGTVPVMHTNDLYEKFKQEHP